MFKNNFKKKDYIIIGTSIIVSLLIPMLGMFIIIALGTFILKSLTTKKIV